ncbi:MAG: alpha-beta hydrolase superfamily lysophospholipase [Hyphomicrobiaceae bacterium]|jgi:alpha-beta hydrolase superfamily lysophospholipase
MCSYMDCTDDRLSRPDGFELFRRRCRPDGPPRAVLVLVHGMSEYSGRYGHVFEALSAQGVACVGYDQRGHGLSDGERGTVGAFEDFLGDLEAVLEETRKEFPGLPLFVLAHSMGGLIFAAYLLEKTQLPDFAIFSGPAIVPTLSADEPAIDPGRLSRDPAMCEAYLNDPLILRDRVQESLYFRLADGLALLPGRAGEISLPVLLIHGDDDPLCSADGAEAWLRESASEDLTVCRYPEGRHEMLNEINRDEVIADLLNWIQARL